MSKIRIRWASRAEASYEKEFDPVDVPGTVKRAIEEAYGDDEPMPFEVDLDELDIDDPDELAEFEDESTTTEVTVAERWVEGVRAIMPTAAELGIPGVVHVHEILDDDSLAAAGDAYRDAKEVD